MIGNIIGWVTSNAMPLFSLLTGGTVTVVILWKLFWLIIEKVKLNGKTVEEMLSGYLQEIIIDIVKKSGTAIYKRVIVKVPAGESRDKAIKLVQGLGDVIDPIWDESVTGKYA